MPKLPVVSGSEVVRALEKACFQQMRQRGSHVIMIKRAERLYAVTVPMHKELAPGTLRSIIRDAGLTVEEFVDLLA